MSNLNCEDIRKQVMFYIDNELTEENRVLILEHLKQCMDCQNYLNEEKELKSKICLKLKDSYLCQCDVKGLTESIKGKIKDIINI